MSWNWRVCKLWISAIWHLVGVVSEVRPDFEVALVFGVEIEGFGLGVYFVGAMAVEVFGCRSVLVWWILSELWGFGSTLVEWDDD